MLHYRTMGIFLQDWLSNMHIMNCCVYMIVHNVIWLQSVQVMGSFDGWSQGEHLSPEYNGSYTTFSTTMMLRPGRYVLPENITGH